jgi:hypothetical protein
MNEQRFIKEFLFPAADDEEEDGDDRQENIINGDEDRKRSLLAVKCHADGYFRK